jgi:hypothetical protein
MYAGRAVVGMPDHRLGAHGLDSRLYVGIDVVSSSDGLCLLCVI